MPARRTARTLIVALLTGALTVSVAWAGIGLAPVTDAVDELGDQVTGLVEDAESESAAVAALTPGQFVVGAAKVSIEPKPAAYGGTWQKEGCATTDEDAGAETFGHLGNLRLPWPENPDCLYMGGFGIGPSNPIKEWDQEYGLWVRALYISDGKDSLVLTQIDGTSYFGRYDSMCDGCGAFDIAEELGEKYKIDPAGFMMASTHAHSAPDFIGGWGGVPTWYMNQVHDAFRTAIGKAITTSAPASVEAGDSLSRRFNGERRDLYWSAEDNTMSWVRFTNSATGAGIATMAAYAGHPTSFGSRAVRAHADFHGVFAKRVEERFGGTGLLFQTGLGNMSSSGGWDGVGNGLAALIPDIGGGQAVTGTDVKVKQTFWSQPITNIPLGTLGAVGFFDRPFTPLGFVEAGKHDVRYCRSVSPLGVTTAVSAASVGNLTFTGAPGEVFSNLTNTIEEEAPGIAFPLAQVNDGLGYIMQSFETDHVGRQGVGFVGTVEVGDDDVVLSEYEDAYGLDACFGDAVLMKTLRLMSDLRSGA
jgi:hypothetical protein